MSDILLSLVSFVVAISILIAIHEFGHFWVAKKLGVKILRYSIGFGKPLWKKVAGKDKTEYVIAAIPLGGYVKMLDEREGDVKTEELERAFNRQPVSKRFAIVLAGPVFNFLFAVFAYWITFVNGIQGMVPVVGEVLPDTPAQIAGMQGNERIVSVNGVATPIWDGVLKEILPSIVDKKSINITTQTSNAIEKKYQLDFSATNETFDDVDLFKLIGIQQWRPPISTTLGVIVKGKPAAIAGIKSGDIIKKINGEPINDWYDMAAMIAALPGKLLNIEIERNGRRLNIRVTTEIAKSGNKEIGRLGVGPADKFNIPEDMFASYQYSLVAGLQKAINQTWSFSVLTLKLMGKMIIGELSLKNISGPINIARYAGQSASAGVSRFFEFLAMISISLGIINLMPIPILDGGHLFYYLIEAVKGSPVSEAVEAVGQKIGIVLLLMLMSLAFYNDIIRLVG